MALTGFLDGPYWTFYGRVGYGTHKLGDPYLHACPVAIIDPIITVRGERVDPKDIAISGGVPTMMAFASRPPARGAYVVAAKMFADIGYDRITYERLGERPRQVALTFGADGVLHMGKTNDLMKTVSAHDHVLPGGGINQETAGKAIDEMRALHKAGKTKITAAETTHGVDSTGSYYKSILVARPISMTD